MSQHQSRIQRAILSVTDKTGLVDFAHKLSALNIELISTGGTAKLLRDSGIVVKDISDLTGFPEMLDGRVKTLHPKVHGGILYRREDPKHVAAVAEHGIAPIDMVVVNLYAFEKTAAKPDVKFHELIENIDIGGPSMIRSAAKNHARVTVVCEPADYARVLLAIEHHRDQAAQADAELLVRVGGLGDDRARVELDEVEHRRITEERSRAHAVGEQERSDPVEPEDARSGHAGSMSPRPLRRPAGCSVGRNVFGVRANLL